MVIKSDSRSVKQRKSILPVNALSLFFPVSGPDSALLHRNNPFFKIGVSDYLF